MGENQPKEFGWGLRLLVMAYGLGLVLIGSQPFRKNYGSILDYLAHDSVANAREWLSGTGKALQERGRNELNSTAQAGPAIDGRGAAEDGVVEGREKKLDHLTKDDRSKLNNLIEGL